MNLFTQCACVLLESAPATDVLLRGLRGWEVVGPQSPAPGDDGWVACGPGFAVELSNGTQVIVDVVDRPWPDDPGRAAGDPVLSSAWCAGLFGPGSAPGALARAREQSWAWPGGAGAAERHRAVIRMRTLVGLDDGALELPREHDPVHELTSLAELGGALVRLPGALGLFFPGGEALRSREQVEAAMGRRAGHGPPSVELWSNTRGLGLGEEAGTRWMLVDVVGMGQARLPDQEALFAEGQEDAEAAAGLLRGACLRLLAGKPVAEGATADDGRGRRWRVSAARGVLPPGRRLMRWLPEGSARPAEAFLARLPRPAPPPAAPR